MNREAASYEIHKSSVACIVPPCSDLIAPVLNYGAIHFEQREGGQLVACDTSSCLCRDDSGRTVLANGHVPRAKGHLESLGAEVQVIDHRVFDPSKFHFDDDRRAEIERAWPRLANALGDHTEGVLESARGKRNQLISSICKLYPHARIFVATSTIERTSEICSSVADYVGGVVEAVNRGTWRYSRSTRIVVGTFTSLDTCNPQHWDLVLYEDATEAFAKLPLESRFEFDQHKIYAFTDPSDHRSDKETLQQEAVAGPVIYRDGGRLVTASPTVTFARYSAPAVPSPNDHRQRREQLFRHRERNQAVVAIARAFEAGDFTRLYQQGIVVDPELDQLPADPVILVESVAQGRELMKLLPNDWRLQHAIPGTGGSINRAGAAETISRTVITAVAASTLRSFSAAAVIMATGGPTPCIPADLFQQFAAPLVIDLADELNSVVAADTHCRLTAYRRLGCSISGSEPEPAQRESRQRSGRNRQRRNRSRQPATNT